MTPTGKRAVTDGANIPASSKPFASSYFPLEVPLLEFLSLPAFGGRGGGGEESRRQVEDRPNLNGPSGAIRTTSREEDLRALADERLVSISPMD